MRKFFGYITLCFFSFVLKAAAQDSEPLTLKSCLNKAFNENSELKTIDNLLAIQIENQKVIKTSLFPDLSLNAGFNEAIQNSRLTFIDNIIPPSEIVGARTSGRSGAINASIDLVNYAQTIMAIKASKYDVQAQFQENVEQQNQIIIAVAKAYTDCLLSQETVKLLEYRKITSEQITTIAQKKIAIGLIDSATYYQTVINAEKDAMTADRAKTTSNNALRLLMELVGAEINGIELDTGVFALTTFNSYGGKVLSVDSNYSVRSLEFKMLTEQYTQRRAGFAMFPHISAFANYGFSNQTYQNGLVSESYAIGPSYGISLGYEFGAVKNAVHQRNISKLEEANTSEKLNQKRREIENRHVFLNAQIEDIKLAIDAGQRIERIANLTLRTALLSFELGTKTITELRGIQNELLMTVFELKQNKLDLLLLGMELHALQNNLKSYLLTE